MDKVRSANSDSVATNFSEDDITDVIITSKLLNLEYCRNVPPAGDIIGRYLFAMKVLTKVVSDNESDLIPVLIARNVNVDILETIPTIFDNYHVKCEVRDSCLFIVEFASKDPHGGGTHSLTDQASDWNKSQKYFGVRSDVIMGGGYAPDFALTIRGMYHNLASPVLPHLVIVELEVGNRSIAGMRRDFLRYFQDHPTLLGVVGIKMFGEEACRGRRAVAVYWERTQLGIRVGGVWDFGVEPISFAAMKYFEEDIDKEPAGALPPVPINRWADNRFAPVSNHILEGALLPANHMIGEDALARLNSAEVRNGTLWMRSQHDSTTLYAGGSRPVVRFAAADLVVHLVTLPAKDPPLEDFVLDLGEVLFGVVAEGLARIE